jgi:hypothetical protein
MALLDLFRPQPDWKHADPEVRAAAVRRLPSTDLDTLTAIARGDAESRVRRAAVRRLSAVDVLTEIARGDADESVRREAGDVLLELALRATDAPGGISALAALSDSKALAAAARDAQLRDVRRAALERLDDPRALAQVARAGQDVGLRVAAVERLADPGLLAEIALKCEQKAVALAAVERVDELEALRAVAAQARHRAAANRAAARLALLAPVEPAAAAASPGPDDEADRARWEQAREAERARQAEIERRAAERAEARQARVALCERLEALYDGDLEAELDRARHDWNLLPAADEAAGLERRFADAAQGLAERARNREAASALLPQLEALCAAAEALQTQDDPGAARKALSELTSQWSELRKAGAGDRELQRRFDAAAGQVRRRTAEAGAERGKRLADNKARLLALCEAVEALAKAEHPSLKDADHRLHELRDALADPGPLASKADREQVLGRLKAARQALYPRVQQLREDAEWKRWASSELREDLCARAEALAGETDLERADRELREIEAEWRRAIAGAREVPAELTRRWHAAHDPLRARCDSFMAERHKEWDENLRLKQALCVRAEALADSTDWLKTAEELQRLQAEWKAAGPVHARHSKPIWERFRKPCDQFFTRRKADLDQRKESWGKNLERKQALCARAEELSQSSDWDAAAAELKRLQAQWKEIGPVRKSHSDAIWQRFRAACDGFFERYKQRDQIEARSQAAEREALLAEAEAWLPAADGGAPVEAPADLAERVLQLQARWRQAKPLARDAAAALDERLVKLRNGLVAAYPDRFRGTELDPDANRKKRERVIEKAEALLANVQATEAPAAGASVAEQLRNALAANAFGGRAAAEARSRGFAEELHQIRAAWGRLGPLSGADAESFQARFDSACSRVQRLLPRGLR